MASATTASWRSWPCRRPVSMACDSPASRSSRSSKASRSRATSARSSDPRGRRRSRCGHRRRPGVRPLEPQRHPGQHRHGLLGAARGQHFGRRSCVPRGARHPGRRGRPRGRPAIRPGRPHGLARDRPWRRSRRPVGHVAGRRRDPGPASRCWAPPTASMSRRRRRCSSSRRDASGVRASAGPSAATGSGPCRTRRRR